MKTFISLLLLLSLPAAAQSLIPVPAGVWLHYQTMTTNLVALDAKAYDLRTAYMAEVKAVGKERFNGRLNTQEYDAKIKEVQQRFDTARAPIEKETRELTQKRQEIQAKYKIKDTMPKPEFPRYGDPGKRPRQAKTTPARNPSPSP